jgi:hypothetical protein
VSAWDSHPDDGTEGMPKHLGRKHCVDYFQFLAREDWLNWLNLTSCLVRKIL